MDRFEFENLQACNHVFCEVALKAHPEIGGKPYRDLYAQARQALDEGDINTLNKIKDTLGWNILNCPNSRYICISFRILNNVTWQPICVTWYCCPWRLWHYLPWPTAALPLIIFWVCLCRVTSTAWEDTISRLLMMTSTWLSRILPCWGRNLTTRWDWTIWNTSARPILRVCAMARAWARPDR